MRLIDADELKENLKKWFPKFTLDGIEDKTLFNQILHDIDNAPTIPQTIVTEFNGCDNCELERPKGNWIKWNFKTFGPMGDWEYKCDRCEKVYDGEYNFCPNCGADMQKGGTPNG